MTDPWWTREPDVEVALPAPDPNPPTCTQCGHVAEREPDPQRPGRTRWDVGPRLTKWANPGDHGGEFGTVKRCHDNAACRERVHGYGMLWEVNDGHQDIGPNGEDLRAPARAAAAGDPIWDAE